MDGRPMELSEFVGQEPAKYIIGAMVQAARNEGRPVGHILLSGPPGIGKTTLARIVAAELSMPFYELSGPTVTRATLIRTMMGLDGPSVVLVDEIHRIPPENVEILYPAMDDFTLVLGFPLPIPQFTLIGTTTEPSLVPAPLRSRFVVDIHLSFYSEQELATIVARYAQWRGLSLTKDAAMEIARRSRQTPRVARQLVTIIADFVASSNVGKGTAITQGMVSYWLDPIVDSTGISESELGYLIALAAKFGGGPVGLSTIAGVIGESPKSIAGTVEPFLIRSGLIEITTQGRRLTPKGFAYILPRIRNGKTQESQAKTRCGHD